MAKKSGSAGNPVPPAAPTEPEDADVADPGKAAEIKAEQTQTKSGKYGSQKAKPFKPPTAEGGEAAEKGGEAAEQAQSEGEGQEKKTSWIEIELVGEDDEPIPGEKYTITLPDESVAEGTLDEKGFARIEGFEKGACKVSFPELDKEAWEKI